MTAPTSKDRLWTAFRNLVRGELPELLYLGVWEYQVQEATSSTFSGSPTTQSVPLPPIVAAPLRFGVPGASAAPAVGSLVLVAFVNGDPSRPVVIGYDATSAGSVSLDAAGSVTVGASSPAVNLGKAIAPVIRVGDTITVGSASGPVVLTGAPSVVKA